MDEGVRSTDTDTIKKYYIIRLSVCISLEKAEQTRVLVVWVHYGLDQFRWNVSGAQVFTM